MNAEEEGALLNATYWDGYTNGIKFARIEFNRFLSDFSEEQNHDC